MARAPSTQVQQIRVADGGQLAPEVSAENVGPANYVRKLNMRRHKDQEIRQEGWVKFEPNEAGDSQYIFDGAETLLRLAHFSRPNGDKVWIGASRQTIKKFDTGTGTWTSINGALTFSSSGLRWQAHALSGYLILNNGVDLPVYYRVQDAAVTPLYELRMMGIASCRRMNVINGFLLVANLKEIQDDQLDAFMRGYSTFTVTGTSAKNANFSVVAGDSGTRFDVTTGAGAIVATLPGTVPAATAGFYVWLKKVDAGAGTVTTSPAIINQAITLSAQNDTALIWSDGVRYVAKKFAGGTIPADDPWGDVPSDIINHLPSWITNSDAEDPTNWALLFDVPMAAASTTLTLPYAPTTWTAGVTRVAVIGGGANGGTLGGQTGYEEGILVTAISGRQITLELTTDVSISYPRTVQVTKWEDVSTLSARYDLGGDGSEILGLEALGNLVCASQDKRWFVGRFTGDETNPFVFGEKYVGPNVPAYGDCIASINGDYLLYPALAGRFYKFDAASYPVIHTTTDDARSIFFDDLDENTEPWCVENPATRQIYFVAKTRTLAYDTEFNSCSEIDVAFDAAAWGVRPGSTDNWFALGVGGDVFVYGLVAGETPIHTWLRDGVAPTALLKWGLNSAADQSNEKDWLSYTPLLASASDDVAMQFQLYGTRNPSVAATALLNPVESLPSMDTDNLVNLLFREIYVQDQLTLTSATDVDFRLTGRIFELQRLGGGGVPRKNL